MFAEGVEVVVGEDASVAARGGADVQMEADVGLEPEATIRMTLRGFLKDGPLGISGELVQLIVQEGCGREKKSLARGPALIVFRRAQHAFSPAEKSTETEPRGTIF